MPEWDDGATWPRRPRSRADSIRPPRKKSGCRFTFAAFAAAGALLLLSLLIPFIAVVRAAVDMAGLYGDPVDAVYVGLFLLLLVSRVRWLV